MPKTTNKTVKEPIITVRIVRGKGTPAMRAAWSRLWQKLISEVKND